MIRIGVSGWRYAGWRGDFYPTGLRQKDELSHVGERMSSVEINGSFYSLQRPTSYQRWRSSVPDDFVFAVKGSRYVTHMKALRDVETPLANFFASGPLALGPTLGPLLWQLPERLVFDEELVATFLGLLPRSHGEAATLAARHDDRIVDERAFTQAEVTAPLRHAFEPRHESWNSPTARALLADHGAALVHADTAGRFPTMGDGTADFHYVRLHGEQKLYAGGYSDETLDAWAGRLVQWDAAGEDTYVYFDNDIDGRAPWDALHLLDRVSP
ncbi:DUF72 domain-containing protein [Knoellia sp. LjRoot47]|uniref:DUF72 domain-containing protein n=1 Tax=Knoellia sp. LjRoot47 TaxID=3342330 RepID=UPI003ED119A9